MRLSLNKAIFIFPNNENNSILQYLQHNTLTYASLAVRVEHHALRTSTLHILGVVLRDARVTAAAIVLLAQTCGE